MKKNVWLLGAAVAALTSCTQSEVLDVPEGKKIQFESFVEKPTRAVSDLLSSTFTSAWIFGYCVPNNNSTAPANFSSFGDNPTSVESVFTETALTKNGTSWDVASQDEKHWKTDHSYRFAGYSDGNNKLAEGIVSYNPESDQLSISSYTVVDANDDGDPKDLVAAIAGDRHSSTGATPVNFQFRHLLSKITFYITNASGNADLYLTDIKLNNVYKTAKCVCTYQNSVTESYPKNVKWTSSGDAQEFDIEDIIVSHVAGSTTHQEITYYVIPQSNASVTLTLLLEEKMGGGVHYSINETFPLNTGATNVRTGYTVTNEWVPGYHYKYTLTRGTTFNQIEFNVNIDTWNEDRDGNGSYEEGDNVTLGTPTP